ncbi:MAG: paraquat-inducible protein A, partial [Planctomycetota bacterium]
MDNRAESEVTMEQALDGTKLAACHCCGMVHSLPQLRARQVARCMRCSSVIHSPDPSGRSNLRARALALAALLLFPVAVTLPIMRIEHFGDLQDASIWSGTLSLVEEGAWFVGGVVFLCSL